KHFPPRRQISPPRGIRVLRVPGPGRVVRPHRATARPRARAGRGPTLAWRRCRRRRLRVSATTAPPPWPVPRRPPGPRPTGRLTAPRSERPRPAVPPASVPVARRAVRTRAPGRPGPGRRDLVGPVRGRPGPVLRVRVPAPRVPAPGQVTTRSARPRPAWVRRLRRGPRARAHRAVRAVPLL